MASLTREGNGRCVVQFIGVDGKRRSIRLGNMDQPEAEQLRLRVEDLVAAARCGRTIGDDVARWLAGLDRGLADKLARTGLIPSTTLGPFLDSYIAGRKKLKPNTRRNYEVSRKHLLEFFGPEKHLREVSAGDADEYREFLIGAGLSPATIGREVKRARQFFRVAVRKRLLLDNPFSDVKVDAQDNPAREYFITRTVAQKVLAACPDAQWRLVFALARYAGLRVPSEILPLKWIDVDWAHDRMTVPSPKTEHNPGGDCRIIPVFAELRPYLEEVFDQAEPGTVYVITRYRKANANLRTQLERIIKRAGLKPWPKLFQNLRSSCETELAQEYPLKTACTWIGNSERIAAKHYLQVTDDHFAQATRGRAAGSGAVAGQNAMDRPVAPIRTERHGMQQALEGQGLVLAGATQYDSVQPYITPPGGVEPPFSD